MNILVIQMCGQGTESGNPLAYGLRTADEQIPKDVTTHRRCEIFQTKSNHWENKAT